MSGVRGHACRRRQARVPATTHAPPATTHASPASARPAGGSSQSSRDRICGLLTGSGPLAACRSAIVYVAFKEDANQLARLLGARGISARAYHAGKDYRVRGACTHACLPACLPGGGAGPGVGA